MTLLCWRWHRERGEGRGRCRQIRTRLTKTMGAELSSQTNGNFALAGRGACDPGGRDETGGREEGLRLRPTATRSVQAVIRSPDAACRAGGRPRFRLDGCVSGRANDGLHAEAEPLCCVASPTTVACMQLQCSDPRGHCAVAFWVRIKLRRHQQGALVH